MLSFLLKALFRVRENVCKALDIRPQDLDLSMGMSNDYEHAVSTEFCYFILILVQWVIFGCFYYKCRLLDGSEAFKKM